MTTRTVKNIDTASSAKTSFTRAVLQWPAAFIAARLPSILAQDITLCNRWYKSNGYYKFPIGKKIDCKGPQYVGYGLNAQGWEVIGYAHSTFGDSYEVKTNEGNVEIHSKWNIENHFKTANPNAVPFDTTRFDRKIAAPQI